MKSRKLNLIGLTVVLIVLITTMSFAIYLSPDVQQPLEKEPNLEKVQDQRAKLPTQISSDQYGTNSWDSILNQTGLTQLHELGFNGTGINIGIIDNGVDVLHPGLDDKNITEKDFHTEDTGSTETHGTPVAGVIIGTDDGLIDGAAPGASLYSAEMSSDSTDTVIFGNFTAAVTWMAQHDVDIINTSFGGYYNWTAMVQIAKDNDIILVGSAGNDGIDKPPSGPGVEPYGIAVGAIDIFDAVASYSSSGPTAQYLAKPDIVAYGDIETVNVVSGTDVYTGTSFATPIVTGGIATVLSILSYHNISRTPGEIKAAMMQASSPVSGPSYAQGYGLTNFSKMVDILNSTVEIIEIQGEELIEEYEVVYSGIVEDLPVQIIGMRQDYSIEITGNISDIIDLDVQFDDTILPLTMNTTDAVPAIYTGDISVLNGTTIIGTGQLKLLVDGPVRAIVGVDYYHSDDYILGQDNLLNRDNEFALQMRQYAIWPQYILGDYTNINLHQFDIIYLKNYMDVGNTVESQFVSQMLDDPEIQILSEYKAGGGKILVDYESTDHTSTSKLDNIDSILSLGGMQIDRDDLDVPVITTRIINQSLIGSTVSQLDIHGLSISGGQSLTVESSALSSSDDGEMVALTDYIVSSDLVIDIFRWLATDVYFSLNSIDRTDDYMVINYSGGTGSEIAHIVRRDYDNKLISRTTSTIMSSEMAKSVNITVENGQYEITIHDPNTENYLRVDRYTNTSLVIDKGSPEIIVDYNRTTFIVNHTRGEKYAHIYFEVSDNHEISAVRGRVQNTSIGISQNQTSHVYHIAVDTQLMQSGNITVTLSVRDIAGNIATRNVEILVHKNIEQQNTTTILHPDNNSPTLPDRSDNKLSTVSIILITLISVLIIITGIVWYIKSIRN